MGVSTVFKFGGFTPQGIICNFMIGLNVHCTFVVPWLCDLAFRGIEVPGRSYNSLVGSFERL